MKTGVEACSVVPCCLHSCDRAEYLVLQNNSFSAPHRCADREGQGVSCEGVGGGGISEEESLERGNRQGGGG